MIKGLDIKKYNQNCDITKREIKDIAIIGIDIKLNGVENEYDFWDLLSNSRENIHPLSEERIQKVNDFCGTSSPFKSGKERPIGGYFDAIDEFDYDYFRILPREAELMNPAQRLLLMSARDLFENAGYTDEDLYGSDMGVYLGMISDTGINKYKELVQKNSDVAFLQLGAVGNLASITSGRISYFWNLKGPSILIDTACSSSLVALHIACNALRNGDCKKAVVSGINLDILPGFNDVKVGFESASNKTRPFSDNADGTAFGEGVVSILIKPLEAAVYDRDNIYAIIKGSAVNQDGNSMGITAPNPEAQKNVILKAWENAGVNPCDISYIEAHGTGTILGDPIEVEGISGAFVQTQRKKQSCAIGSVKSNIGHLYGAAGLASLVKCVLALRNRKIPSSLNFDLPNSKIDFQNGYVYVADHLTEWEGEKLLCGISSFGFCGTNCHLIMEESHSGMRYSEAPMLFTISAKTEGELAETVRVYREFIKVHDDICYQDICYTTCVGRKHEKLRLAAWVSSKEELLNFLAEARNNEIPEERQMDNCKIDEMLKSNEGILSAYLSGRDVPWETVFKDINAHKICLPNVVHHKKKCWIGNVDKKNKKNETDQGNYEDTYSEIENEIGRIVMYAMGIDSIDVHCELMDYGGSSVLLAEVYAKINESYPDMLTLPQLFIYSSIEKISHYIDDKRGGKASQKKGSGSVKMLDDEIDAMFENLENGSNSLEDALEKLMTF